jgi:RNA polymerase sigma factor (sigma-70 family)
MHPDNRYIEALRMNHSTLIGEIYERHAAKIERLILANNGTSADAADIFQEALTDLFNKSHQGFVLTCPLDAFLYCICKNKWITVLNKKKRQPVTFTDTVGYTVGEDVFKALDQHKLAVEQEELLNEQFDKLGDGCKELLRHSQAGTRLEEVARQMGTTYGYIRKKKSECMAKLLSLVKSSAKYKLLFS